MTRIIPCLDAKDGKVVKGINFENIKEVGSIEDLAKKYSDEGADEIIILDITATTSGNESALDYLKKVRANSSIPVTMGGGIRSVEDAEKILDLGASKVLVNSAAVKDPGLVSRLIEKLGPDKLVIAIDSAYDKAKEGYRVYINAGQTDMGPLEDWVRDLEKRGVKEVLPTSKDKDGTKSGFDLGLYQLIAKETKLEMIASGGAGKLRDFSEVIKIKNVTGVLAASLFHYEEVGIDQLRSYMDLDFSKMDGIIPAIVVDSQSKEVLMQGFMNDEALEKTMEKGKITFYSRSKNRLWTKGEESGNYLDLVKIFTDCDNDSLLLYARPQGPTCHTGQKSCFYKEIYEVN